MSACRTCGGSGLVAHKRSIDDGYGEVDTCPSCDERGPSGLFVIRTDRGLFWGPNRGGYCRNVEDAGLYSEAEARRLAGDLRCGQDRHDEVIPADAFRDEVRARADRITEFLVSLALGKAADAVDPHAASTGKPSTRV